MPKKPAKGTKSRGENPNNERAATWRIEQLAHKTGYAPEYLQEIEDGKVSPPVGVLIQISRALAVDSASLLAEEKKERARKELP